MAELTRKEIVLALVGIPEPKRLSHAIKVRLAGLDLSGLDLSDLNLSYVDFSRSDLSGCNLENAYLDSAFILDANFDGVNMHGACTENACIGSTTFVGARLTNLWGTNMCAEGADFTDADMTGARLSYGDFNIAKFRRTKLIDVTMDNAMFGANDWHGVKVKGGHWFDAEELILNVGKGPAKFPFKLSAAQTTRKPFAKGGK